MASEIDRLQEMLGAFFLWVNEAPGEEKYVFKFETGKVHYTLRFWEQQREFDFHRTDENYPIGDPQRYEQYFRMSYYTVARILAAFRKSGIDKLPHELIRSKIRCGQLKRNHSILVPHDPNHAGFEGLVKINSRPSGKKRIRLNAQHDFSSMVEFILPEDALDHPVKSFTVYQYRHGNLRMRGHVYRYPNTKLHGARSFVYFSNELRQNWMKRFSVTFYTILSSVQFQNKAAVIAYLKQHLLNTYMSNHPLVKARQNKAAPI